MVIEIEGVQRLQLSDSEGVKWEIRTITDSTISLYHRGKRSMHYQKRSAEATRGGVESLLSYIKRHEEYERSKHHGLR